jgi:hypothetical protein
MLQLVLAGVPLLPTVTLPSNHHGCCCRCYCHYCYLSTAQGNETSMHIPQLTGI